jgi:hypothetical protein
MTGYCNAVRKLEKKFEGLVKRAYTRDRVIGMTYRPYLRTPHALYWAPGPDHQSAVLQTGIHSEFNEPLSKTGVHSTRLVSLGVPNSHSTREDQETLGSQRSGCALACINCNQCARYLAPLNPLLTPGNGGIHGTAGRHYISHPPAPFQGFASSVNIHSII